MGISEAARLLVSPPRAFGRTTRRQKNAAAVKGHGGDGRWHRTIPWPKRPSSSGKGKATASEQRTPCVKGKRRGLDSGVSLNDVFSPRHPLLLLVARVFRVYNNRGIWSRNR